MSTQFVRYTPDIEAADPYFDQNLQTVIGKLEEYIAGSVTTEGTGRAVRDAHAKGYGVVKAEVEILGSCPRSTRRVSTRYPESMALSSASPTDSRTLDPTCYSARWREWP
jgi:hypothetical protein